MKEVEHEHVALLCGNGLEGQYAHESDQGSQHGRESDRESRYEYGRKGYEAHDSGEAHSGGDGER